MSKLTVLKIADLTLALASELPLLFAPNPFYAPFISTADETTAIDLVINFEVRDFVPQATWQKIETFPGNRWQLYKDNSDFFIIPEIPHSKWTLRFNAAFDDIRIYCGADNLVVAADGTPALQNVFLRPLDQIILMYYLLKRQAAMVHATCLAIGDDGYVFPGISEAGKSTLAKLFMANGMAACLSDERVIIRKDNHGFVAYGTPWPSSAAVVANRKVPLRGIFFIAKGGAPIIRALTPQAAATKFLAVTSIPWYDAQFTTLAFAFLDQLVNTVPAYEFSYRPDAAAVRAFLMHVGKDHI